MESPKLSDYLLEKKKKARSVNSGDLGAEGRGRKAQNRALSKTCSGRKMEVR